MRGWVCIQRPNIINVKESWIRPSGNRKRKEDLFVMIQKSNPVTELRRQGSVRVRKGRHSQLQQSQVGVAVVSLIFALFHDIFGEDFGGLGVVAVEAIEDGVDVLRPVRRVIECDAHDCCEVVRRGADGGDVREVWTAQNEDQCT